MRDLLILTLMLWSAPSMAATELVVSQDGVPLHWRCGEAGSGASMLEQGQRVKLRFSIAGSDERCYSVSADIDGKTVSGYVAREFLVGVDEIEEQRRSSTTIQSIPETAVRVELEAPEASESETSPEVDQAVGRAMKLLDAGDWAQVIKVLDEVRAPETDRNAAVLRAQSWLQLARPTEALAAVEVALLERPNDATLLGLAGVSHFRRDHIPEAIKLLKKSLAIEPNPYFASVYGKIQREAEADESTSARHGSRFVLRYEGEAVSDAAARKLVTELDREINRISFKLGCPVDDRLTVIVQTHDNYRKGSGVADWSAGHYDGRIHLSMLPSGELDDQVRETLSHEYVHACLTRRGRWPVWLHEGLAQLHSGARLSAERRALLAELNGDSRLPSLRQLSGSWGRLDPATARVAYDLALAAAQVLYQDFQDYGVRNLLGDPSQLTRVTAQLDKRLHESLR